MASSPLAPSLYSVILPCLRKKGNCRAPGAGQEHLLLKEQPRKEARITCGFHHFSANAEIFD
jgi:hypothetical protein